MSEGEASSLGAKASQKPVIRVGTHGKVESRTWPGINKPGGFAKVKKVHCDEIGNVLRIDVSYIVEGGTEKALDVRWFTPRDLAEDSGKRTASNKVRCAYCNAFEDDCSCGSFKCFDYDDYEECDDVDDLVANRVGGNNGVASVDEYDHIGDDEPLFIRLRNNRLKIKAKALRKKYRRRKNVGGGQASQTSDASRPVQTPDASRALKMSQASQLSVTPTTTAVATLTSAATPASSTTPSTLATEGCSTSTTRLPTMFHQTGANDYSLQPGSDQKVSAAATQASPIIAQASPIARMDEATQESPTTQATETLATPQALRPTYSAPATHQASLPQIAGGYDNDGNDFLQAEGDGVHAHDFVFEGEDIEYSELLKYCLDKSERLRASLEARKERSKSNEGNLRSFHEECIKTLIRGGIDQLCCAAERLTDKKYRKERKEMKKRDANFMLGIEIFTLELDKLNDAVQDFITSIRTKLNEIGEDNNEEDDSCFDDDGDDEYEDDDVMSETNDDFDDLDEMDYYSAEDGGGARYKQDLPEFDKHAHATIKRKPREIIDENFNSANDSKFVRSKRKKQKTTASRFEREGQRNSNGVSIERGRGVQAPSGRPSHREARNDRSEEIRDDHGGGDHGEPLNIRELWAKNASKPPSQEKRRQIRAQRTGERRRSDIGSRPDKQDGKDVTINREDEDEDEDVDEEEDPDPFLLLRRGEGSTNFDGRQLGAFFRTEPAALPTPTPFQPLDVSVALPDHEGQADVLREFINFLRGPYARQRKQVVNKSLMDLKRRFLKGKREEGEKVREILKVDENFQVFKDLLDSLNVADGNLITEGSTDEDMDFSLISLDVCLLMYSVRRDNKEKQTRKTYVEVAVREIINVFYSKYKINSKYCDIKELSNTIAYCRERSCLGMLLTTLASIEECPMGVFAKRCKIRWDKKKVEQINKQDGREGIPRNEIEAAYFLYGITTLFSAYKFKFNDEYLFSRVSTHDDAGSSSMDFLYQLLFHYRAAVLSKQVEADRKEHENEFNCHIPMHPVHRARIDDELIYAERMIAKEDILGGDTATHTSHIKFDFIVEIITRMAPLLVNRVYETKGEERIFPRTNSEKWKRCEEALSTYAELRVNPNLLSATDIFVGHFKSHSKLDAMLPARALCRRVLAIGTSLLKAIGSKKAKRNRALNWVDDQLAKMKIWDGLGYNFYSKQTVRAADGSREARSQ